MEMPTTNIDVNEYGKYAPNANANNIPKLQVNIIDEPRTPRTESDDISAM